MADWQAVLNDKIVLSSDSSRVKDIPLKRLQTFQWGPLLIEWNEEMTDLTVGSQNYIAMPANGKQQRKSIPMMGYKMRGEQIWYSLHLGHIQVSRSR